MREPRSKILIGDVREQLDRIPAGRVQTCVTSPPYFRQRNYQVEGQIGLESTPEEYVATMVDVFRGVWRVLRDDGVVWLNLGDKYWTDSPVRGASSEAFSTWDKNQTASRGGLRGTAGRHGGLKNKDLIGIPWRVALALQADGWVLRSDVIWHKHNAMPGSQEDRPTCNHEYVFLLTKQSRYFYDGFAIREKSKGIWDAGSAASGQRKHQSRPGNPLSRKAFNGAVSDPEWATKRTVWSVSIASESESHFAVFPPKLIIPCILAGTSSKGRCPHCYAPRKRITEKDRQPTRPGKNTKVTGDSEKEGNRDPQRHVTSIKTVGWEPTCNCDYKPEEAEPCLVLDPFLGSGTTSAVAVSKGRDAVGIELNPEYVKMAERKIKKAKARKGFGVTV